MTICSGLLIPCDLHHQQVKVLNFKILCNKAEYITALMYCFLICLLCVTASEPEVKSKSEKDELKEKYPALCKPDAPVWTVRLIESVGKI